MREVWCGRASSAGRCGAGGPAVRGGLQRWRKTAAVPSGAAPPQAAALERLQRLTARLEEMEAWFDSVKAEAASERRIREQATTRLGLMQERLDRLKEQVAAQSAENKAQPRPPNPRPSRHRSRLR